MSNLSSPGSRDWRWEEIAATTSDDTYFGLSHFEYNIMSTVLWYQYVGFVLEIHYLENIYL